MINIIGFFAGEFGIGVVSRNVARLIARKGAPPACSLVPGGMGRDRVAPPFPTPEPGVLNLAYPSTLIISGAVPGELMAHFAKFVRGKTRLGILAYWELTEIKPESIPFLECADVLFAGSPFSLEVYRRYFPRTPCVELPCPMDPGAPRAVADRSRFGLPADVPLVLATFEPISDITRKNADGAIRAFLMSSANHAAKLVLKVNWPRDVHKDEGLPAYRNSREIIEIARRNPRIIVVDQALEYDDLLGLYACADALVSLHRSEGLGLVMLEAMALGIPVITTGHSGNMAYTDETYPGLVRFTLVPSASRDSFYDASNYPQVPVWAEPDLDHAAGLITRALTDAAFAAQMRRQGLDMAERYLSRAESAHWLEALIPKAPPPAPRFGTSQANIKYSF